MIIGGTVYLQRSLHKSFSPLSQALGVSLQRSRSSVFIEMGGLKEVRARVQEDGNVFAVSLRREADRIYPACGCKQFAFEPCPHLWAVILESDRGSYLLGGFSAGRPTLAFTAGAPQAPPKPSTEVAPPPSFMSRALRRRQRLGVATQAVPAPPKRPQWEVALIELNQQLKADRPRARGVPDKEREYYFLLDLEETRLGSFYVKIACRERTQSGTWGKLKTTNLTWPQLLAVENTAMSAAIRSLAGSPTMYNEMAVAPTAFSLNHPEACNILSALAETGRLLLRPQSSNDLPACTVLNWDPRPARLRVVMEREGDEWVLRDRYEVPGMQPNMITLMTAQGVMIVGERVCRLDYGDSFDWVELLKRRKEIRVPVAQGERFVGEMMKLGATTTVELPEQLRYREESPEPTAVIRLQHPKNGDSSIARATLECRYGKLTVGPDTALAMHDAAARTVIRRSPEKEKAFQSDLMAAGFRLKQPAYYDFNQHEWWEIKTARLSAALSELIRKQFLVESEGRAFRTAGAFSAKLNTGIDWFELEGEVEFDGQKITMPELLKAVVKGDSMVTLDDGSIGLLPEEFLARYGGLLQMAQVDGGQVRFARTQSGLLDVFLAELPEIKPDERLAKLRAGLAGFRGVQPEPQPAGFTGQLRGYQQEGLAWMSFLEHIELGGCLADDMGVGKTPQVLALLERRRAIGKGPSLVVVPRSLIFNWKEEALRFTPALKILDYSAADRDKSGAAFGAANVVLTTYGTMLRDVATLREHRFDYAILDEAQAIKNHGSESAKAARLLRAEHRLVMTGTPIENHLGELWSLFEFLNPGMLGAAALFQSTSKNARAVDEATRVVLARALRPFILRRTKGQVAKELPERIEQTIHCELEGEQKKLYTELRDFYRAKLLGKAGGKDAAKNKIQVLEALLRLRQAACHPGLIDKKRTGESSAKLETLLERLSQVREEGHKALVFSQFTSLLAIVRQRLDSAGVTYEYLDGDTRDRQACVHRFQKDDNCQLFLISLKAGGTGLNLTAAEYVFLLDPWWNPAVEAQAIDRAHRIGQARTVVACRLIAQGTVEERVLELQKSKRDLAEAIIGEDNRLIGNLQREDLELLLS